MTVVLDATPAGERALATAAELAQSLSAALHVFVMQFRVRPGPTARVSQRGSSLVWAATRHRVRTSRTTGDAAGAAPSAAGRLSAYSGAPGAGDSRGRLRRRVCQYCAQSGGSPELIRRRPTPARIILTMKRLLFLLLLLGIAAGAVWKLTRAEPVAVRVHEVARGRVEATVANTRVGTVEACRRAQMSPAASGQVALLYVKEGDSVKAGDVLLEIWNDDQQANLMLAEVEVDAAKARADQACAMAAGARREAARVDETARRGRRLRGRDRPDRHRGGIPPGGLHSRASTIGVAKRRIEVVRHALERTVLRAPFGGVIAEVNAKLGEYLTPSRSGDSNRAGYRPYRSHLPFCLRSHR